MKYRPEIDGLRAVAVLPVILFHAGFSTFSGGFVGVDIFFVISGYLITSIILKDLEAGSFSFWEFYERRARRILPALFFVIICCIPFAWMWMMPLELKAFSTSVVAVSVFMSNILFWRQSGYFDTAAELKPLLHTWSLAVEEQFYIFFPIAMLILWRLGRKNAVAAIAFVAVISLALSEYGSRYHPSFNFYWLPTRAWELAAGSLCAFVAIKETGLRDDVLSVAGLAAIVFAIFYYDSTTPFPSLYALVPVLGTCTIILYARQGTIVGSLLSLKAFVGIGLISYSAYLWHQPLFAFARIRSLTEPSYHLMITLVVASIVLAYFSWRYIEVPARKRGALPLPKRKTAFALSTTVASLLIAFGLAGHFTKGFPERLPTEVNSLINSAIVGNSRAGCSEISELSSCVYGDPRNVRFLLLGDSHSHALAYELGAELRSLGEGFRALTRFGCPPIHSYKRVDSGLNDCGEHHKSTIELLKSDASIDTVILFARWTFFIELDRFNNGEGGREVGGPVVPIISQFGGESPSDLHSQIAELYKRSIEEIVGLGKRVVIIYPQPEVGWDVPALLGKSALYGEDVTRPLSTSYSRFRERSLRAYAALDGIEESKYILRILPEKLFCNTMIKNRCVAEDGNYSFYRDDDHVNNLGAGLIAKEVVRAMIEKGWIN
jgi:peptidoglycan/LPS O-acetylase OafA/YrhL